jgi:hypothetical protein
MIKRPQLYVICANDFPYCILPEETTVERAAEIITRLKSEEKQRQEDQPNTIFVYYYVRLIDIIENPILLYTN